MAKNDKNKTIEKVGEAGRARKTSARLGGLFAIVLAVFVALIVRLIFITRGNSSYYQEKILAQQSYDSKVLNAKRGQIIDANGTVLADSKEVYNIILDVKALLARDKENAENNPLDARKSQNATVTQLVNIFGADRTTIENYISNVPNSQYYKVKTGVSYEEMNRFKQLITKPSDGNVENSLYDENITGVWFEKYYVRDYPQGSLACDVIGLSLSETSASYGIEEYYNDELTGTSGRKFGFLSDDTNYEITTIPATDGNTVQLTIDAVIQQIVEKYLAEFNATYKNNARKGLGANNLGCIIMRANTGEILAMAGFPNFDLNNPMDISAYYSETEIAKMKEEGTIKDAYDSLWKNFCISDTYEPGSVMKPFTVAMGIESGKVKGTESYTCHGYLTVGEYKIPCHETKGEGVLTTRQAVAKSCNVALMQIAKKIGKETFLKYQTAFNLGLKTNIDLAGEARTDSVVFNERTMNETELATASFGQGFNVTMIQMIAGYAALVNGGYYYEPHVVSKILSSGGSVVKTIEPRLIKQLISNETSDTIRSFCNSVVTDGTGWRAKPAGYSIGGKTGTAETVPRGNGEYVVSFMSHAPSDNPEIICYVVVDRPNVKKQEDAKYATGITRQILTEVLPYLNIYMTEKVSEKEMQELMELELSIYTNRVKEEDAAEAKAEAENEEKN